MARNRSAGVIKESQTLRKKIPITMCCRSNRSVTRTNDIAIQRDLGDWIDIDYKTQMHP